MRFSYYFYNNLDIMEENIPDKTSWHGQVQLDYQPSASSAISTNSSGNRTISQPGCIS